MFVIVGWAIAMVCIFGVYIFHGGNIQVVLKALPFEMITIFGAIKVFDIVWVMTMGGPNDSSHTLATYMYRSAFQTDRVGYGAAVAVVMFALSAVFGILNLLLQRRGER